MSLRRHFLLFRQALGVASAIIVSPPAFAQEPIDQIRRELAALREEVQQLRAQLDALKGETPTAAPPPPLEMLQTQLAELAQTKVESTTRLPSFTALAGTDGRFALDLPAGRFRLTAMSERTSPVSVELVSTAGASTVPELTLDESAWAFAQHMNKFGKDYPVAAYQR